MKWILPIIAVILLFAMELFLGSVSISMGEIWSVLTGNSNDDVNEIIIKQSRLPRAVVASMSGAGLALCGLLMQRFFQNPLAGPSVLGITSGASLGVALVIMAGGAFLGSWGVIGGAFMGAMVVLLLIILFSTRSVSPTTLLIFGLMVGYLVGALVTILQFGSTKESLRSFVFWGMGSFADRSWVETGVLSLVVFIGAALTFLLHRQLDLWSLGEEYARSMGLNHQRFRIYILVLTGMMTGVITAYCGPIAFLGLAVPHLARGLWSSGRHRVLVPAVMITGMIVALGCDLISRLPGTEGGLPLNAVTSFLGAPVVIAIILKGRRVF